MTLRPSPSDLDEAFVAQDIIRNQTKRVLIRFNYLARLDHSAFCRKDGERINQIIDARWHFCNRKWKMPPETSANSAPH